MSTQEFNKYRLNAKRLSDIKRFDSPQCFVLKTSNQRQLDSDAILLQVLQLNLGLNRSEETRAALDKDQQTSKAEILSPEDENNPLL